MFLCSNIWKNIDDQWGWLFPIYGLELGTFFSHILGIIIPTDELIFFRAVGIPPTRI